MALIVTYTGDPGGKRGSGQSQVSVHDCRDSYSDIIISTISSDYCLFCIVEHDLVKTVTTKSKPSFMDKHSQQFLV
jgi:hypothetical protein